MTTKKELSFVEKLEQAIIEKEALVTTEKGTTFDHTKVKDVFDEAGFDPSLLEKQTALSTHVVNAVASAFATRDLGDFLKEGPTAERSCSYKLGGQKVHIHQQGEFTVRNPATKENKLVKGYVGVHVNVKSPSTNPYVKTRVLAALDALENQ